VNVDRTRPLAVNQLALGVTHTQYSLDSWGNAAAVAAGKSLLSASSVYQNQHIMGWGADNPEPSPGAYNWSSLDARLQLIRSTGGTPVITLCCAPDWMKGGSAGSTDWSQLEVAPQPAHYADFAALAQAVARRYPDVTRYQVWNELKGFWNAGANRWDYEGYTAFYNQVYDALKAVSPAIQVGGPYAIMDNNPGHQGSSNFGNPRLSGAYGSIDPRVLDILTYWLANKHGGDFIVVDGLTTVNGDPFASTQGFADVTSWIRGKTGLPVWWAEWYATPWGGAEYSDAQQNAVLTDALVHLARGGASAALRWQPQAAPGRDDESLWTDTRLAGGGQPFPFFYASQAIKQSFGPGAQLYDVGVSSASVEALSTGARTLLVNTSPTAASVSVDGAVPLSLPGYGVIVTP
jgi:hypothetical protein